MAVSGIKKLNKLKEKVHQLILDGIVDNVEQERFCKRLESISEEMESVWKYFRDHQRTDYKAKFVRFFKDEPDKLDRMFIAVDDSDGNEKVLFAISIYSSLFYGRKYAVRLQTPEKEIGIEI